MYVEYLGIRQVEILEGLWNLNVDLSILKFRVHFPNIFIMLHSCIEH